MSYHAFTDYRKTYNGSCCGTASCVAFSFETPSNYNFLSWKYYAATLMCTDRCGTTTRVLNLLVESVFVYS